MGPFTSMYRKLNSIGKFIEECRCVIKTKCLLTVYIVNTDNVHIVTCLELFKMIRETLITYK